MTKFRPCIDLHEGKVKQIVGGSLNDSGKDLQTNFIANHGADYFAHMYKNDNLLRGHIIMLGKENEEAAMQALEVWPNKFHVGGGITIDNAETWLQFGAEKVIITSWLFTEGKFDLNRLIQISSKIEKEKLVVDLSCRRKEDKWYVTTNKWQTISDLEITYDTLQELSKYCSEFLIHGADVEGLCQGIDEELIEILGKWSPIPCTYAGGGQNISDLKTVNDISNGRIDLTFGSALDIFGAPEKHQVKYVDCVQWNIDIYY